MGDRGEKSAAYRGFSEFYPFYLSQHADRRCRWLHFAGTSLGLAGLLHALATLDFRWLAAGDWVMWRDMLLGRVKF